MLKFISKQKNKKGFTLIELVVVIAILAILAAIAVPRLIGFQDRARQQADNQVAAQVKNTLALLYANGEIVVATTPATFTVGGTGGVATVTNYTDGELTDRSGTDLTAADVADLIEELVTDIDLQSTRLIDCTIEDTGAVEAILD